MDFHGIHLPDPGERGAVGKKIASGRNSNIYEWESGKVIKIYKPSYPMEKITAEYYNALAVKNLPFKKAAALELKKTQFGYGIVFEKADGESLSAYIRRSGDLKGAAAQLASVQKSINSCVFKELKPEALETAHQKLRQRMQDSEKAGSSATKEMLRFLQTMQDGNVLCHGRLDPDHVILSDEGPVAVSASDYCIGTPLYDVAVTFYLIAYTDFGGEQAPGCDCPGCKGISDMEEKKEFGRYYLNAMGKTATQIGGYLSMIIAGL